MNPWLETPKAMLRKAAISRLLEEKQNVIKLNEIMRQIYICIGIIGIFCFVVGRQVKHLQQRVVELETKVAALEARK